MSRAGPEQQFKVGEVVVHRVPLDAGPFRDRSDRGSGQSDLAVELEGGCRDPLAGFVQGLLAATHPVAAAGLWILLLNHVQRKY